MTAANPTRRRSGPHASASRRMGRPPRPQLWVVLALTEAPPDFARRWSTRLPAQEPRDAPPLRAPSPVALMLKC